MFASGEFSGRSGHEMTGDFTLEKVNDGYRLLTNEDFFFDAAAPGPVWALGIPDSSPFPALIEGSIWHELTPFVPVDGIQDLFIPSQFPIDLAPAIITWCAVANVPLGEGPIIRVGASNDK